MIELNENITNEMNKYLEGITIQEILMVKKKLFHFQVNFTNEQLRQDIEVLDLSVRSYNCLKRAGFNTLGNLVNEIYTKDGETSKHQLLRIRNLGKNSADEILIKLMNYKFMILSESRRKAYMDKILEINFNKIS